ncbi:M20 family metallopeptidase [Acetomicrobium sp.]|jgi:amidohydrolase|uniref:M20 family metallopeptidase n=1 Tax=Acetomicrobium sp. TaxID=1872099 RepID=UPI002B25D8ED|nr:M20 family metallopeptidase [Acetomicrobium sp.]HOM97490.1 M20 family metallopeptidase [Acetomicrobium sp.]
MDVKALAKNVKDYVIDLRREFHMYPERSGEEFRTSQRVKEELDKLGIPYTTAGGTGVIGIIKGEKPGKTVALRADMDALEVYEKNDIPYKSKTDGLMHACGHDGHTAMLLGAAKVLSMIKNELKGCVKLFFQPAEEIAQGALKMIDDGAMEGVDSVFAIHLWSGLPMGKISVEAGPRMAAVDVFDITVNGKGGHGSAPHEGVDALVAASDIVMALQTIVSRELSPLEPVVVTVGKLVAGTRFNVLASEAKLEGTNRYFNPKIKDVLPQAIERMAKNVAAGYRAEAHLNYQFATSPVINDPECSALATRAVEKILGKDGLIEYEKVMGGEDFAEFLKEAPGALALVGIGNEEKKTTYPHHHPNFNIDEDALEIGVALYVQYALDYLNQS